MKTCISFVLSMALVLALVFSLPGLARAELTGTPVAATVNNLVGLGMNPELAEYVSSMTTILSNAEYIQSKDQAGTGQLVLLGADATDDTVLNADSGDLIKFAVARTPSAALGAPTPLAAWTPLGTADLHLNGDLIVGTDITSIAGNLTMTAGNVVLASGYSLKNSVRTSVTPVAAYPTSGVATPASIGFNVLPTAMATAANYVALPLATTSVGQDVIIFNKTAQTANLSPLGANTQGLAAAGTPYACTTGKVCVCRGLETGTWGCM